MKRLLRNIIAAALAAVFLVITFSPLLSHAMRSKPVTRTSSSECSGDCDTCGCSLERRATQSCCCRQKKQQHGNHCDEEADLNSNQTKSAPAMLTSTCPCGSENHFTFYSNDELHILPARFSGEIPVFLEDRLSPAVPKSLSGRSDEPPVPPPELSNPS